MVDLPESHEDPTPEPPPMSTSPRGPRPRYSTYNDVLKARESISMARIGSDYAPLSVNMRDIADCCSELTSSDGAACYIRPKVLFRSSQVIDAEDIIHYNIKMTFDLRVPPVPCKVSHHNIRQRLSRWLTHWVVWVRHSILGESNRSLMRSNTALMVDEERLSEYPRCIRCSRNSEAVYGVKGLDVYHVDLLPSYVSFWIFYQLPYWIKARVIWMKLIGMQPEAVEHYVANMIAKDDVLGFFNLYKIILRGSKRRIARSFRLLFKFDRLPALVHCIHGKDRTGIIVALLQLLAGVPREAIIRDYAISFTLLREGRDKEKLSVIPEPLTTDAVMASSEIVRDVLCQSPDCSVVLHHTARLTYQLALVLYAGNGEDPRLYSGDVWQRRGVSISGWNVAG